MPFSDDLHRNLRHGLRQMAGAPLLTLATLLTLTLGIGVDAGVFTLINGMMLRPRVEADVASFAHLYAEYSGRGAHDLGGQMSLQAYRAMREAPSLQQLAAWSPVRIRLEDDATPDTGLYVSCEFFSVYGLDRPRLGRLFRPDECAQAPGPPVAVLSEELWASRFHRDPALIGKPVLLNRQPFVVVGVAPLNFSGRLRGLGVWLPYTTQPLLTSSEDRFRLDDSPWLWLEGRLRPGRSRTQLAAELNVIAARLDRAHPDITTTVDVSSGAMIDDPNARAAMKFVLPLIITGLTLLLLTACANVAVLLLSRAVARRREIAVRISLGATTRRLVAMLVTENLLLAFGAGSLGLWLALQLPLIFRRMFPTLPYYPFTLDWHIFFYLATITLIAALLAGVAPAIESLKLDVWPALQGHETQLARGRSRWSMRDALIVVQVAFSLILTAAAGLFVRAERAMLSSDPGLDTRNVMMMSLHLPTQQYDDDARESFYRTLLPRLEALPGVQAVAWTSGSPLLPDPETSTADAFYLPAQTREQGHAAVAHAVSANYLSAIGIPVLHGRALQPTVADEQSVVVSQAFAASFWPGRDPLGELIVAPDGERLRVVGIARDARADRIGTPDGPHAYRLRGSPASGDMLLIRFAGSSENDAQPLENAIRSTVHALDPDLLASPLTLRANLVDIAEKFARLVDMMLFLAVTAAALAVIGIYGVVSYLVSRRTREFGIRSALGASGAQLIRLVFLSGGKPVAAGMAIGLALAVASAVAITIGLRYTPVTLDPYDPILYASLVGLMTVSALAAMARHARRASRVDPAVALREQ